MLASWVLGDSFKLVYFFLTEGYTPLAFKACAGFQLSVDIALCIQTWLFREQTAVDERNIAEEEPLASVDPEP